MKKFLLVLSFWTAFLPLGQASQIVTLFDTTNNPSEGLYFPTGYELYSSFSTLGSDFILQDVQLVLAPGAAVTGLLTVNLYADAGGGYPYDPASGSALAQWGTISDQKVATGGLGIYDLHAGGPDARPNGYLLQANTTYWIGIESVYPDPDNPSNPSNVISSSLLSYIYDMTGTTGVNGQYYYDTSAADGQIPWAMGTTYGAYQLKISGVDAPEPATLLLGGLGLGILGLMRLRRSAI